MNVMVVRCFLPLQAALLLAGIVDHSPIRGFVQVFGFDFWFAFVVVGFLVVVFRWVRFLALLLVY
jgi:hypothetical protein